MQIILKGMKMTVYAGNAKFISKNAEQYAETYEFICSYHKKLEKIIDDLQKKIDEYASGNNFVFKSKEDVQDFIDINRIIAFYAQFIIRKAPICADFLKKLEPTLQNLNKL